MDPPNKNNDRGFVSSSRSSVWPEQSSSSQSFPVEASSSRTIEFHVPQPSHFAVQRQVMHPGALVQVLQGHHHIGRGLIHDHTGENETLAQEWIAQQQFQHQQERLHQQEIGLQHSESQAQRQAESEGTYYNNSHDQYMASRQLQMEQLSIQERQIQEQWAQAQIAFIGCCTAGFAWTRDGDGYRCMGGDHYITDALLAEGQGGWYLRKNGEQVMYRNAKEKWEGPMYTLEEEMAYAASQPPQLIKYAGGSGGSGGSKKRGWTRQKRRG